MLPHATPEERRLITRDIRAEGRIGNLHTFTRSHKGRADLADRLAKLRTERRTNPEHGMSPPVGHQLRCDEGWDDPDTVHRGIAAARAALRRPPRKTAA